MFIFLKSTQNFAFVDTHHEGVWKKFFDPSYVPMRFFEAVPGWARAIQKIVFAGFPFFYIKMKLLQGDRTPK
jgi:hypothetical protein